ncbi:MAG: adenylate/guanylate cyclase domain-containing protein [Planctomycetota bacterium]
MTAATTLQTFLFTDLVGSTELKRALGDAEASAAIAQHDALFRRCLAEFDGVEQNNPGDGFFATFTVPSAAIRCALAFQKGLRELELPRPLEARAGIHMGESSLVPGAQGLRKRATQCRRQLLGAVGHWSPCPANEVSLNRKRRTSGYRARRVRRLVRRRRWPLTQQVKDRPRKETGPNCHADDERSAARHRAGYG